MRWLMPLVLFPIRLAMGYQFQSVASTATQFVHMSVVGLGWTLFNASLIVFVSFAPDMLVQLGHEPGAARTIASLVIWTTLVSLPLGGRVMGLVGFVTSAMVVCLSLAAAPVFSSAAMTAGVVLGVGCLRVPQSRWSIDGESELWEDPASSR